MPTAFATLAVALAAALAAGCGGDDAEPPAAQETGPRVVQPGAPGEDPREVPESELEGIEPPGHTPADVAFMQNMILHHRQALRMTDLVPARSARDDIPLFARRLEISQAEELELMERWLTERGEDIPPPGAEDEHAGHLPGMLTEAELVELERAEGRRFDRLFLRSMLRHHEGALAMVAQLQAEDDAGQEPEIAAFVDHVLSDQAIEIERMRALLADVGG